MAAPNWVLYSQPGLMIGMELALPAAEVVALAFKRGLIVNATAGTVLRMHPPLNVSAKELKAGLKILSGVLRDIATIHHKKG